MSHRIKKCNYETRAGYYRDTRIRIACLERREMRVRQVSRRAFCRDIDALGLFVPYDTCVSSTCKRSWSHDVTVYQDSITCSKENIYIQLFKDGRVRVHVQAVSRWTSSGPDAYDWSSLYERTHDMSRTRSGLPEHLSTRLDAILAILKRYGVWSGSSV